MRAVQDLLTTVLILLILAIAASPVAAAPEGQMTWAVHISLAPAWFDPAETQFTSFMILYALHDALVKPLPGSAMAPSLAESWTVSADGLVYEFVLRKGVRFHNGDPVTSADVKFSFERYKGTAAPVLKSRVAAVEVVDSQRVRFRLKQPWPDFMTYYGTTATGSGWVVPKKYIEKVGDKGFKKAPVGAGPYRFVSFAPGVELVLEAFDQYWRKVPSVKRLIFRVIPDEATRFAMLKRGDADVAYSMSGALAEGVRRTSGLTLGATPVSTMFWVVPVDQWDPKSPWHDRRVRLAANYAIDRPAVNQARYLGFAKISSSIIPASFGFFWQPPAYPYDPDKAKQLLAEAGYVRGFDAGDYFCDAAFVNGAEAIVNYLEAVGIRMQLRPFERAAFEAQYQEKKLKNLVHTVSAAAGNAATRIEQYAVGGGFYVYGNYPDIDGLFREQAAEIDVMKRTIILNRIQELMHEKAMFMPMWQGTHLHGVGPRVVHSGMGLIAEYPFSAPYEDVRLRVK